MKLSARLHSLECASLGTWPILEQLWLRRLVKQKLWERWMRHLSVLHCAVGRWQALASCRTHCGFRQRTRFTRRPRRRWHLLTRRWRKSGESVTVICCYYNCSIDGHYYRLSVICRLQLAYSKVTSAIIIWVLLNLPVLLHRRCFWIWRLLKQSLFKGSMLHIFIIMVALWNKADHYIFALWFLLSSFFFSPPNPSRRRLDVFHTSTHGVALVRI